LPAVHSEDILSVLRAIARNGTTLANCGVAYDRTACWDETNDVKKTHTIRRETQWPTRIDHLILNGPHIHVGNPLFKVPNEGCSHNQDYTEIDLSQIPDDYLPRTNYVPDVTMDEYHQRAPRFGDSSFLKHYRLAYRRMAAITGERTLITAIIPPGVAHIGGIISVAVGDLLTLVLFSGITFSIVADAFIKITGRSDIRSEIEKLPLATGRRVQRLIIARSLRLNCLTIYYKDLWESVYDPSMPRDGFIKSDPRLASWAHLGKSWNRGVALRTDYERRQALVEIDALVAIAYGLSEEELVTLYRVYFSVLQEYERSDRFYDVTGRLVPKKIVEEWQRAWRIAQGEEAMPRGKGLVVYEDALKANYVPVNPHTAEPFDRCDREEDLRQAYRAFTQIVREATA